MMSFNVSRVLISILAIVAIGVFLIGCNNGESSGDSNGDSQLYTCGMHPDVISEESGLCPICNMNLTPIKRSGGLSTESGIASSFIVDTDQIPIAVIIKVRTITRTLFVKLYLITFSINSDYSPFR